MKEWDTLNLEIEIEQGERGICPAVGQRGLIRIIYPHHKHQNFVISALSLFETIFSYVLHFEGPVTGELDSFNKASETEEEEKNNRQFHIVLCSSRVFN